MVQYPHWDNPLTEIEELIEIYPDLALARLMSVLPVWNADIQNDPSILEKLEKWLREFLANTHKLAEKLDVDEVSVTSGEGLSVTFNWLTYNTHCYRTTKWIVRIVLCVCCKNLNIIL